MSGGITELRQDRPHGRREVRVDTEEIVRLATQSCPVNATHWNTRSMAAMAKTSPATVRRIWRAHGLKPYRFAAFKVSRDPKFVEKLEDIVGLYMNPPENALVLLCDEKSPVQALDRTQPGPPAEGEGTNHDS